MPRRKRLLFTAVLTYPYALLKIGHPSMEEPFENALLVVAAVAVAFANGEVRFVISWIGDIAKYSTHVLGKRMRRPRIVYVKPSTLRTIPDVHVSVPGFIVFEVGVSVVVVGVWGPALRTRSEPIRMYTGRSSSVMQLKSQ